ncbi:MAG: hypothetical protein MK135_04115 [Polyangiaceae bacterium]|nr:hypothetical protein [Polyangiaceae bacterium]
MTVDRPRHYPIRRQRQERQERNAAKTPLHTKAEEEREEAAPRRERRALSHVGGEVYFSQGNDEEKAALAHALDVDAEEEAVMRDMHGFHSYPARLHPETARRLIEGFSKPGDHIYDPFSGSGTVVAEARAAGRCASGSDLNPLAIELAWLKSRGLLPKQTAQLLASAQRIAEVADARRLAKADPYQLYDNDARERYPIHILLELDSLAHGVGLLPRSDEQRALRLVISSLLTKLSHSEGDTTRQKAPRRLRSGFAIELFVKKTEELKRRLDAYSARLPQRVEKAYIGFSDARDLEKVEDGSIDLIVTSPPYPGVYDYLEHHLHRMRWLGMREGPLRNGEMGSRRVYRTIRFRDAVDLWHRELGDTLREMWRVLSSHGRGVMIIADSVVDRQALYADDEFKKIAEQNGIDVTAIASQERPLFLHGAERVFADRPRMEHVVVFRRSAVPPARRIHRGYNDERPERFRQHSRRHSDRPNRGRQEDRGRPDGRRFEGRGRQDGRPFENRGRYDEKRPSGSGGERRDRFPGNRQAEGRRPYRDDGHQPKNQGRSGNANAFRQERPNRNSTGEPRTNQGDSEKEPSA